MTRENKNGIVLYKYWYNVKRGLVVYMEEKKKASAAHMKATAKWEKENYDKVLVRFPKGTKEKIVSSGAESVNGFIVNAVLEKLKK